MSDWAMRVYNKSCEDMSEIPDASVQTCVTSPPYYGLRDYGVDGQVGLDSTVSEYVGRLVSVFREVRRTLRDDGTAWLNLGDSYAGTSKSSRTQGNATRAGLVKNAPGVKPKDLMGIPWTVAFALRDDGWYLRDAIVWHKPNPMPSSVQDRCTPAYEMIFMLSKKSRYFSDMESVRERLADATIGRIAQAKWQSGEQAGSLRANGGAKTNGPMRAVVNANGLARPPQLEDGPGRYNLAGANLRNVWSIATTPYGEAHFSTFPIELPMRCIRIGSRQGDVVLDPFMGSGSTAEAAEALGRRWVGYELNAEYLPLIAKRTQQAGLFGGAA